MLESKRFSYLGVKALSGFDFAGGGWAFYIGDPVDWRVLGLKVGGRR